MKVTIQGRGINVRDELKAYIEKELDRLEKFFDRIIDADVVLDGKLHKKEASIKIKVPDQTLVGSGIADKFEIAVEDSVDKLVEQLKRYKAKLRAR